MESKTKNILYYLFGAIACIIIGVFIGWNLGQGGAKQSHFNLQFGDNQLEVKLDKEQMDAASFLSNMFSMDFSKSSVIAWLKDKQKIFHFEDPHIVNEFKTLPPEHPVSEQLFKLSTSKSGPWSYQIDTVKISIPEKAFQPKKGTVNVCENGKYLGRELELFNLDQSIKVEVNATGKYACPPNYKFPDIQLNAKDAEKLLGRNNFSKYEKAVALIVQH